MPDKVAVYITGFQASGLTIERGALKLEATGGYVIRTAGALPSITCLGCGMTSRNPTDVDQRYCGRCHIFHEEPTA